MIIATAQLCQKLSWNEIDVLEGWEGVLVVCIKGVWNTLSHSLTTSIQADPQLQNQTDHIIAW